LFPIIPLVGFGICLILIPSLDYFVLQLGGLLSLIGLMVYLIYGRRRNKAHVDWLNENGITHP
jgi:hypothetical protein